MKTLRHLYFARHTLSLMRGGPPHPLDPAHCEVPLRINTKLDPLLSIPSAVQAAHNIEGDQLENGEPKHNKNI